MELMVIETEKIAPHKKGQPSRADESKQLLPAG
jgi:hypothetical protein